MSFSISVVQTSLLVGLCYGSIRRRGLTDSQVVRSRIVIPPEKSKPIGVRRFDQRPVIDGKIDEDVWKSATLLKDFYQINPGDNISPSKPTEVLLGYDERFFYIAF